MSISLLHAIGSLTIVIASTRSRNGRRPPGLAAHWPDPLQSAVFVLFPSVCSEQCVADVLSGRMFSLGTTSNPRMHGKSEPRHAGAKLDTFRAVIVDHG